MNPTRSLFLQTCNDVLTALGDPRISAAWDQQSVLEEQTVGSVAAHVGRGCWVALQYLDTGVPSGPVDFDSAADYYAKLLDAATPEMHAGIRERGAEGAKSGPSGVRQQLVDEMTALESRLTDEPEDHLISVYGENVMTLDDYLETRIVEQVVHLDDLSRSVRGEPFAITPAAEELVIACGADIGRRRFGGTAVVRALFRDDASSSDSIPFPVL